MADTSIIGNLIIYMVVLLLAISAHEAAHAWMSYKFGDDTAYLLGRVTLNPVSHIDPIGTLLIPIVNFLVASGGGFSPLIGWGKPTPVNPLRWRNKDMANVMVSLAGIMVNILIAVISFVVLKALLSAGTLREGGALGAAGEPVGLLLFQSLMMNASLAVFNLLPFPPLDGSKVLYSILPSSAVPFLEGLEQYGFILLMAAVYFGLVGAIFRPVARLIEYLLFM
ncbi:MAG TPA: site-2 protease family protein [Pyrinomonadaceae bacterium]|nr:site-2 protease family protein [Pyrinomonadaceae bacterium]